MNERIFHDMADQMKPDDDLVAALLKRLDGDDEPVDAPVAAGVAVDAPKVAAIRPRRRSFAWVAAAACLAVLASTGVWAIGHQTSTPVAGESEAADGAAAAPAPAASVAPVIAPDVDAASVVPVTAYGELYKAVNAAMERYYGTGPYYGSGVIFSGAARDMAGAVAPMAAPAASGTPLTASYLSSAAGQSFTGTNVQVAGIDEGDIVKTDGRSLYVASGTRVAILTPNGASTRKVASIDTAPKDATAAGAVLDMMLVGNTLVVFVQEYVVQSQIIGGAQPTAYVPYDVKQTKAVLYDVSDPAKPELLTSFGQSGSYTTSRLAGSVLYLVTDYTLNDPAKVAKDIPATYAPQIFDGPTGKPIAPKDVHIVDPAPQPRYSVVTALDVTARKRLGQQSVLAGADTVYMSQDNLYLGAVTWGGKMLADTAKAAGLDASKLSNATTTTVVRIALNGGALAVAAQNAVLGSPLNQFALDESDGYLRIVMDVSGQSGNDWVQRASLFVLDKKLAVVGSVPKLVEGESVRSVRFDGAVGYVVTFRQRDPLFAIDLSKPSKPKVMSALKIPGFSAYLHVWSDGRLLGFGVDAKDDGTQTGLKLSMFDTKDPYAVTQLTSQHITGDDSTALYDHKAVLVDTERGIIGFPVVSWSDGKEPTQRYEVYAYTADKGFVPLENLKVTFKYDDQAVRGVLVGDYLYVCTTGQVDAYTLDSFRKAASVKLS